MLRELRVGFYGLPIEPKMRESTKENLSSDFFLCLPPTKNESSPNLSGGLIILLPRATSRNPCDPEVWRSATLARGNQRNAVGSRAKCRAARTSTIAERKRCLGIVLN